MNWYDLKFLTWDDEDEITKKIVLNPEEAKRLFSDEKECGHIWKDYTGLTEVSQYCIFCDKKRLPSV